MNRILAAWVIAAVFASGLARAEATDPAPWVATLEESPDAPREETLEPVDPKSNFILFGKGIRDKKTGAVLTLACRDSTCAQLRWLIYVNETRAYYLGKTLEVKLQEPGEAKKYFKQMHKIARKDMSGRAFGGIALLAGWGVALTLFLVTKSPDVLVIGALGWGAIAVTSPWKWAQTPKAALSSNQVQKVNDQEGWNWASSPKGVGHGYFAATFRLVARRAMLANMDPSDRKYIDAYSMIYLEPYHELQALAKDLKAYPREKKRDSNASWVWEDDVKVRY